MEMSVREARAKFSQALAAAERGEHVTITKNGRAVAQLGPPPVVKRGGIDWDALDRFRKEHGLDQVKFHWPEDFDDPAFSREVFGLDENPDIEPR